MKQKIYFMLAAAAAFLTACSSNDLSESPAAAQQLDDSAVNFSAYVNRGVTRAGALGTLTTSDGVAPNVSLQEVGFGVFSYYSDSESYSETSKPNFMYNQKVSGENWTYSPLKYWPNEFGKNAASEGQDRLTFFAYAPYVEVNPSTGRILKDADNPETTSATSGIVGMTSNTASGDPYIKYYADMDPDKRVDLCWGVAKDDLNESVDAEYAINAITAGEPYIDVIKPKTGALINFDFKHALASVNVKIDTDINFERVNGQEHPENAADVDNFTRIWVRSVTFEGFTDKGRLNLNSRVGEGEGPQWFDLTNDSPVASGVVSVYDGRTDGKEGRENATAKKETPATLNTKIVQSAPYDKAKLEDATTPKLTISDAVPGVTKTTVNLFDALAAEAPVFVIPTDENLKVTIVYDVETYDPNLATFLSDGAVRGSSIQNTIEKEITFTDGDEVITKLEAGKKYTINLHLGLTSVKFDASVTDWAAGYGTDVDLPYNTADGHYTAEGAAAHNAGLDGAVAVGQEYDPVQYYTEEEIAAHNATLDIWDNTTVKPAVYYTLDDPDLIVHNAAVDIWDETTVKTPASEAQPAVYSFNAFVNADPTTLYAGTVKIISQTATTTTVEVVTNEVADFVGHQYIVNATDLTNGNTFALFETNGDPTELSVQDVALVSDAVPAAPAVYYTLDDPDLIAHNALPENQMWDETTVKTPAGTYTDAEIEEHNATLDIWTAETHKVCQTQEEADAYNATLPGAVHAGEPIQ